MKTLKIDEKWEVEYDPANNDRPVRWLRYGEECGWQTEWNENNAVTAMFYALLAERDGKSDA